jgi:GNAT superfamily N-acetyltransferase
MMGVPISVRLDDDGRSALEAQAQRQGVGSATLLRNLATQAARDAKRARIREDSARVAAYVATSPEAQAFYEFWGTPRSILPD